MKPPVQVLITCLLKAFTIIYSVHAMMRLDQVSYYDVPGCDGMFSVRLSVSGVVCPEGRGQRDRDPPVVFYLGVYKWGEPAW